MPLSFRKIQGECFPLLAAILFYLELQPYFVWGVSGTLLLLAIKVPLVLLLLIKSRNNGIVPALLFAIIASLYALNEGNNIIGSLLTTTVAVLFVCKDYLQIVYKYFKVIYAFFIGVSALVWCLVLCGIQLPVKEILPLNALKDISYFQYPFLVMLGYDPEFSVFRAFRFCGLFDEPGVVGTLALLMLLIDRFNIRKFSNIIILISGLISMSLFFYIGTILYFVYSLTLESINFKTKLVGIIAIGVLLVVSYNNEITHAAIWERLEYDESKKSISGNNRADEALLQYIDSIRWSDKYLFGVHDKMIINQYSDSASIQNAILKYGFIGCLIYALFWGVYIVRRVRPVKDAVFCIFFLFLTLWQRPGMFLFSYVFLYLMLVVGFGKKRRQMTT